MKTPSPFIVQLGRTLRAHRRVRKLSLERVASQAGFSLGYLSSVERGESSISLSLLVSLARVLELPLPELFARVEAAEPAPPPENP